MKILKYKNKTVIIASQDDPPACPRAIIGKGSATIRDDYNGSIKVKNNLINRLFS